MASPRTTFTATLAAAIVAASLTVAPAVALADPAAPATAADAQSQLGDLGRQAEVLTEQMHDAQIALDSANAAKATADASLADAQTRLAAANAQEDTFRGTVDKLTEASYQGARLNRLSALMTSSSPQDLLDQMSGLDMLATDTSSQLSQFQAAGAQAAAASSQAEQATQQAQAAIDTATATTTTLAQQQDQLNVQTAQVKAAFDALTPTVRAAYVGSDIPTGYTAPAAPTSTVTASGTGAAPTGSGVGYAALQAALSKVGSPYVWGATGPSSFDCSGLTSWAYAQAGVRIPRSSGAQAGSGSPVSRANLQPGDLVFFYSPVSHVGIYAGNGMVVHAPTYGQGVKVAPMSQMPYNSARRY